MTTAKTPRSLTIEGVRITAQNFVRFMEREMPLHPLAEYAAALVARKARGNAHTLVMDYETPAGAVTYRFSIVRSAGLITSPGAVEEIGQETITISSFAEEWAAEVLEEAGLLGLPQTETVSEEVA